MEANKKCTRLSKPNLSEQQKELVEGFKKKMDDTFLITDRNAEELISKDKMRDRQQKEEDIAFLTSMKEDRIASVSTKDIVDQARVDNKVKRQDNENRRKQTHSQTKTIRTVVSDEPEEVADDEDDEDFVDMTGKKRKKKENTVTFEIPKNIVQILAPTANRYDVSSTALSSILLQTVSVGGGNIDTLPLSRRQVERTTKSSISKFAGDVKETFKKTAKDKLFVVHFDGKQLEEFTDGVKATKERLSVLVSSPSLDHVQVLGAPALDGQTGDEIFAGVLSLLEEFGVTNSVIGMSFDTTASNTGAHQGSCARLESQLQTALLWLACRRHVMELHIKHVAKVLAENVSGRKETGPVNTLFKRIQDNWPELMPMIDLADLNKFNWRDVAGTELEDQAE